MSISWRAVTEADLPECLALEPRHLGDGIVGLKTARTIWRDLTRDLSFNSGVFIDHASGGPGHIVAFGACVFVRSDFADQELANPRPYMNSRLFASIAAGRSDLLKSSELYSPYSAEGLDVAHLFGSYRSNLNEDQEREVRRLLPFGLAEVLRGYRLNRLLNETVGKVYHEYVQSSGVWRPVQNFSDDRVLHIMTRKEAYAVSGSLAAGIFHYEPPTLRLRDTDKQLLADALHGGSDSELALRLHLSLPSIKKRWQSLFDRVAEVRPDLLPVSENRVSGDARGPQKRHRILAYVRSHPEEVRPYRLPP